MMAWFKGWHWPTWRAVLRALGAAFLTGLATLGVVIVAAMINLLYFNNPPVVVTQLDKPLTHTICPGEVLSVHNQLEVDGPVLLYSYFSVMDENANYNINDTQVSNGPPRPHPHASSFTQTLLWTVPDLPPGRYTRVLAFRGTDGRENSIFSLYNFEIGPDCK